jgi:hypothetical protein
MLTLLPRSCNHVSATTLTFQQRFMQLLSTTSIDSNDPLCTQPGFAIYRNTARKGLIDALQANYPAVSRLVGDEWFLAAAAEFVSQHPASDARLMHYGTEFADYLESFPPAAALPYLADVARLDRLWTVAHTAADDDAISSHALAKLTEDTFATQSLQPRASASWIWSDSQPIFSLWSANRDSETAVIDLKHIAWRGEGAIVLRSTQTVTYHRCDATTIAFLETCRVGQSVADAAASALSVEPECDLQTLIATLLQIPAFTALVVARPEHVATADPNPAHLQNQ